MSTFAQQVPFSIDNPIFQTSLTRLIVIDKVEYFLSYFHDDIPPNKLGSLINFFLGQLIIIQKYPNKDGKILKYSSPQLMSLSSINKNLLQNDPYLIFKIIYILEGSYKGKELVKLDQNEKKLKIISNVKEGINLVMFSCDLTEEIIEDYGEVFRVFMNSYNKKKEMCTEFDKKIEMLREKEGNVNKKLAITKSEVIEKENKLLMLFCTKLNEKKNKLRNLKTLIDNDGMEIKNEELNQTISNNDIQKLNSSSFKFDDSVIHSNNLSLLDL